MNDRNTKQSLGLALITLMVFAAAPCAADQKVSLFDPFALTSESVVVADSTPGMQLSEFVLLTGQSSPAGNLANEMPRPTVNLRGVKIRIPQRPALRSSFSRTQFGANMW